MEIRTQVQAYKLLALHTKGKETINVMDILHHNLLPNYKRDNRKKVNYLCYVVRKLLLTYLGVYPKIDRDSYAYKRINTPGNLLLELYRELWNQFKKRASLKIDTEYKFNFDKSKSDIDSLVNSSNLHTVFDSRILDKIVKSFGSVFGTGISGQQGIVQDLNRNCMLGTLSHIRRLVTPLPPGSKAIGPRKLHGSQWGFVCPTESPDGGNVGIINHLSISCKISFNISEDNIYLALIDNGLIELNDTTKYELHSFSKVFLNGRWIGLHKDPEFLYKIMRLLKCNSLIHIYTSIRWDTVLNEIYVFCDSGRLLRPIFLLQKNGSMISNRLIEGDYSKMNTWNHLIHGEHIYKLDPNCEDCRLSCYKDITTNPVTLPERNINKCLDFQEFPNYSPIRENPNIFIRKQQDTVYDYMTHDICDQGPQKIWNNNTKRSMHDYKCNVRSDDIDEEES